MTYCNDGWCTEDHVFEVDGVRYEPCLARVYTREMIELINPHPLNTNNKFCSVCDGELTPYTHMHFDGMRWSPEYPILRFTSEGLQETWVTQQVKRSTQDQHPTERTMSTTSSADRH